MSAPLLSTKFYVPPPRPALVSRPRLLALLDQGLARPLTLISAPTGFGKTTLLSEWRASAGRDYPLAWLSLDPEDNNPIRFLNYLTAALRNVVPGVSEPAPGMLRSPETIQLQAFLTGLINDLDQFPEPFALVLDDYHLIRSSAVHEIIAFILDHLPQRMHLVLLTRSDPPLPLASLRARSQLVEIRADDLRFSAGEAQAFFNPLMGLALSPGDVAAIEQRTEGWIAALQLAALVIQSPRLAQEPEAIPRFIEAFTGSHHYIADYLSAEVLSRQPEQVRTFLLQTSILERMTAELCDRLLGRSDSLAMLRQLDQANLFLVPLDEQRRWYRYHHLFAELLRSQLQEVASEQLPELHQRAADWYEQNGFVSEAITHALAAGDLQQTARIVEQHAMATLMRGDSTTLLGWIASIAALIPQHPWLGIYQSWALLITGEIEPIETRLQAVESWIAAHPSITDAQELEDHIAAIRALIAGRRGLAQQAITLARRALERLPDSETAIRGVLMLTLGDASWSSGDLVGAMQVFNQAAHMQAATDNILPATGAFSSVAALLVEQGQLRRAAETYQEVVRIATRADGRIMPTAAPAYLGLSGLAYEWNDLDAASRDARQGLELGRRWGNPATLAGIYLLQARIQQAQGQRLDSSEALRQAEELARGPGVPLATAYRIAEFRVRQWLQQANLEAAVRWVGQQALDPGDAFSYQQQIAYLTLARILIAQNRLEVASSLLERILAQFESLGQMGRVLELLLLQALTMNAKGDVTGALAALARALALGEPEGCLRVFLDEGAPMAELLRHAGSRGIAPPYVARLLSEFNRSKAVTADSQQPLIEPLTDRERQVLRLLAEGFSNQAIAERLVIAVGTVKTHTASLYRKLGVSSRTQAVARATQLGLL